MSKRILAFLCILYALPATAADSAHSVSSNIALVSNYMLRGIGQTSSNPAIQGGMNYVHASGLYAGIWGTPVSWIMDRGAVDTVQYGIPTTQVDMYFGHRNIFTTDYGYDIGFIRYSYLGNYSAAPGSALADSAEVYAAISYQYLSAKYSYSVLDQFMTLRDTKGTNYLELNARYAIPHTDYTFSAHLGRQHYVGATADALEAADASPSYTDYKIGIARDIGGYLLSVSHSNTSASSFYTHAKTLGGNWAGPTTVLSLTHSF